MLAVGSTLGPYKIVAPLGAGGMGEVYRAHDSRLGRDVAIKVLPPHLAASSDVRARFEREARTISQLNHPHICTLHDVGHQDGTDYLVMEYVSGTTLEAKLAEGPLPEPEILALGAQIADALAAAHEQGVVHRDLKPANVIVTPKGAAKVLDFGLAKLLQHGPAVSMTSLTESQAIAGTLPYMAPEQLLGAEVDARTDLYALGVLLYEMGAGRRPFEAMSAFALADEIMNSEPPPIAQLRPGLSPALQAIVRRCMEKKPEDRFATAAEVAESLREPTMRRVSALRRREARGDVLRLVVRAGSAVAVLALATLVGLNVGGWRDRLFVPHGRIESLAVLPLVNLTGDPQQDYLVDGMTEELINLVAQAGAVRVISRMSVMSLRGAKLTVPEVGRKLSVDAIVVGTVRRTGDEVKVTAELIRTRPEGQLWAKSYARAAGDVPALQGEIAAAIAQELRLKLTPERRARVTMTRAVSPEAHEAYLKGRFFLNKQEEKWFRTALEYFQQSVQIDPLYAQGWAGVADAYYNLSNLYLAPRVAIPQARAAVEKALQLDPDLPEAHASLGILRAVYDWDWAGAEKEYHRALELNPSLSQGRFYYGYLLAVTGRFDESIAEFKQAMQLEPLSTYVRVFGVWPYYLAGRYDDAIAAWREAEAVEPNYAPIHFNLGQAFEQQGNFPEAISELKKGIALSDNPAPLVFLCHAYARAGRRDDALATLERIKQTVGPRRLSANSMAIAYAGLGDKDDAFRCLERAYVDRDEDLVFLKTDPKFDVLRSDPRFHDLLRRLHLES